MARVLLGWELGAGSHHAVKLARTAVALRARGHAPAIAAPQIGAIAAGEEVWQAPLWKRQLAMLSHPNAQPPATMGDILAILGLDDGQAIAAQIGAWDRILRATRAQAVIAEFAPALMLAARRRLPCLAVGSGFTLPPAELPAFPSLTGQPALRDERALLETVNAALAANARAPLAALPAIFAADLRLPAVFRELDPYRELRSDALGAPSLAGEVPRADEAGTELFVYLNNAQLRPNAFWQGLVDARVPTRLFAAGLNEADKTTLRGAGLTVEDQPLPFAAIAARSRLLLSHGGLGFACSALLAGLPQITVPFDIEKRMTGASLEAMGLGERVEFHGIEAAPFAQAIRRAYGDAAMLARARAAAPGFRARAVRVSEEETVDALEGLLS